MTTPPSMLYYGDNLPILRNRDYFPSESVDLVYLDPPFNSNRNYNVLFSESDGSRSAAQVRAFADTWRWDAASRRSFDETTESGGAAAEALLALQKLVGEGDILAYLAMMAPRLVELRRVLKETGSIYLHCDPTADHYLRLLMEGIFGATNFRNEIVWRRSFSHNDPGKYGANHDTILFFSKGDKWTWNPQYTAFRSEYIERDYRYAEGPDGSVQVLKPGDPLPIGWRRFRQGDLTANKPGGDVSYDWKGVRPYKGRYWAYSKENMEQFEKAGRLLYRSTGMPVYKRYLDEMPGVPLQTFWDDIPLLISGSAERLGYPTQKPEALMDRIVLSSSNPGETVLDPFCGCGTTIASAQKLGRRWIGIDITHLAMTLIRSRLKDAYGDKASYKVIGEPEDVAGAEVLAKQDRYQFQWWALGRIGARPVAEERKKGADSGIDGKLFFREKEGGSIKTIVIQVKSGGLKLSEVRDFAHVITREEAQIGVLLTLDEPTRDMRAEATGMGFYKPEYRLSQDDKYDRYQIITVGELFEGKQPAYPPFRNVTFKAAPEAQAPKPKPKSRIRKLSLPGFSGQGVLRAAESASLDEPDVADE